MLESAINVWPDACITAVANKELIATESLEESQKLEFGLSNTSN